MTVLHPQTMIQMIKMKKTAMIRKENATISKKMKIRRVMLQILTKMRAMMKKLTILISSSQV